MESENKFYNGLVWIITFPILLLGELILLFRFISGSIDLATSIGLSIMLLSGLLLALAGAKMMDAKEVIGI